MGDAHMGAITTAAIPLLHYCKASAHCTPCSSLPPARGQFQVQLASRLHAWVRATGATLALSTGGAAPHPDVLAHVDQVVVIGGGEACGGCMLQCAPACR
jgi:hypothetical protein